MMNVNFMNPFLTAAYNVLSAVLGSVPQKDAVTAQPTNSTSHQVNVVCGVTGDLQGLIVFGMRESTANRIASVMAGQSLKIYDSFVASAIAELGNMISGNALMGLSESGFVCDITPPTIVQGANVVISTLDIPTVSIHLETGCGELAVRVSLAPSAARSKASA
jgi:chemotaxis protein CheX